MANFGNLQLTAKGISEQLKAQSGVALRFSKIKMGSGTFTGDVSTLTNLVETKLSANIVKGTLADDSYTVQAQFTNSGMQTGFYWRELGLFGVDSENNEYLYGYANCGNQADYIPAVSDNVYTKHVSISIAVGSATNITIVNPTETYLDVVTFNQYYSEITDALDSIRATLDDAASTDDLDSVRSDIESQIDTITGDIGTLQNTLTALQNKIGGDPIQSGDSTIIGAINSIYTLVSNMPTIRSGVAAPSGGKDGDVYIQYD